MTGGRPPVRAASPTLFSARPDPPTMAHDLVNYRDVEPVSADLHFLREPLGCEKLGFSVRELSPGETGLEHDHAGDGQEEVYLLVEGEMTMTVDGEAVEMAPGDALRVDPGSTRQLENGEAESLLVIAAAP